MNEAATLDLRGLNCPLPALRTAKRMTALSAGDRLVVLTTDPLASIDIPALCHDAGYELIETGNADGGHRFVLRKPLT